MNINNSKYIFYAFNKKWKSIRECCKYYEVRYGSVVRTVSQEQICARDEHGKLQVYLNNPDIAKYRIESTFIKNECIGCVSRRQ